MDELTRNFPDNVALKYSLYNSLFLALPFHKMQEVGTLLLTLFDKYSAMEIRQGPQPQQIVDAFLKKTAIISKPMTESSYSIIYHAAIC